MTARQEDEKLRAAIANAFLFRCGGVADLALDYLKDSFRIAARAAGQRDLPPPARGGGDRFADWLEAGRAAGLETAGHQALREACRVTTLLPPPLAGATGFKPAVAADEFVAAALDATRAAYGFLKTDPEAARAGYWYALLLDDDQMIAHANLGALAFQKKDWEGAHAHYAAILSLDPTDANAMAGLHAVARERDGMSAVLPHLEALALRQEPPAPSDGAEEAGDPILRITAGQEYAAGDLLMRRGAAHLAGAARIETCLALERRARAWFATHGDGAPWAMVEDDEALRDPMALLVPEMAKVLYRIFGRTPRLSLTDSVVRLVTPKKRGTHVPFHQDITAFSVTGVNVWTPLTTCGVDAPSLELMARRTGRVLPTSTVEGAYNQLEITPETVYREFAPEVRFYPKPEVGDCVLFLGSTVHRSHIAPGMTRDRVSAELRFY